VRFYGTYDEIRGAEIKEGSMPETTENKWKVISRTDTSKINHPEKNKNSKEAAC